jgi:hypothetical protein
VSWRGLAVLVEIKSPGGKLTDAEEEFFENWQGPLIKVETFEEVLEWFEERL